MTLVYIHPPPPRTPKQSILPPNNIDAAGRGAGGGIAAVDAKAFYIAFDTLFPFPYTFNLFYNLFFWLGVYTTKSNFYLKYEIHNLPKICFFLILARSLVLIFERVKCKHVCTIFWIKYILCPLSNIVDIYL